MYELWYTLCSIASLVLVASQNNNALDVDIFDKAAAFEISQQHSLEIKPRKNTLETRGSHSGLLTPQCINHYHRMLQRTVPPRTYRYHHEAIDELSDEISFRIVGGQQVNIEQVPYAVLYGLYCGGALIAPEWVITAAHCKTKEKFVYAGSSLRSLATKYVICAHFVHPLWDAEIHNHDYDYQLILLETPIPVTPQSRPIAIGRPMDIRTGEIVQVSGWGHIRQKEKMQDHIRQVSVPIMDWNFCRSLKVGDYGKISSRMFCAGFRNGTKDSCQGDSGGPAVHNGFLLGLVSFGVGCAEPDQPGVYSNVPLARDWIRYVTALPL